MRALAGFLYATAVMGSAMAISTVTAFEPKDIEKLNAEKKCIECDLSGANLTGADLSNSSFFRTNLTGANLSGAKLTNTGFFEALLVGADLSGADLTGSELDLADLSGADLTNATVSEDELAVAILCNTVLPDRSETNSGCIQKAQNLLAEGRFAEAEVITTEVVSESEITHGSDSPNTAIRLSLLARALAGQHKYSEAEKLFGRVIVIFERSLPHDDPGIVNNLNHLGFLHLDQGRFAEAEKLFLKSVEIVDSSKQHFGIFKYEAFLGLGVSHIQTGKYSDAENVLRRSFSDAPRRRNVAQELYLIGVAIDLQGRALEAEKWFVDILDGADDGVTDFILFNLYGYYESQGRQSKADDIASWSQIRRSTHVADYLTYLDLFPGGMFAGLANQSIETLRSLSSTSAVPRNDSVSEDATPGRIIKDCDDCPELVVVPPGSFRMGSTEVEIMALKAPRHNPGRYYVEAPRHEVNIEHPLAVGRFEITYAEWDACVAATSCGRRPPDRAGRGRKPVVFVSAEEIEQYIAWLSDVTGHSYRLLSEAEWEYVARAGTDTKWSCGDDEKCLGEVAWYAENSGRKTHEVGTKTANAFGVFDMHGNVGELIADCWHESYRGAPSDGSIWGSCTAKIVRGGHFRSEPSELRSASRRGSTNQTGVGFRVARPLN